MAAAQLTRDPPVPRGRPRRASSVCSTPIHGVASGTPRPTGAPPRTARSSGREGWVAIGDATAIAGLALVRPALPRRRLPRAVRRRRHGARTRRCGATLLAHVEAIAFARGRNLFVCVSDFNDGAPRFYGRQGYEQVGTLPDLLVRGSAELLLRKTVGPVRDR